MPRLAAIDRQVAQKEAERATIEATIEKLEAIIPLLQERVEIRKTPVQQGTGLQAHISDRTAGPASASSRKSWCRRAGSAKPTPRIAALEETRIKTVAEYERGLFDDLAKAEQKAAGLAQDVIKAEQRTSLQNLTAPVDGVVQQLAMHTIGGVVTPAQALMRRSFRPTAISRSRR